MKWKFNKSEKRALGFIIAAFIIASCIIAYVEILKIKTYGGVLALAGVIMGLSATGIIVLERMYDKRRKEEMMTSGLCWVLFGINRVHKQIQNGNYLNKQDYDQNVMFFFMNLKQVIQMAHAFANIIDRDYYLNVTNHLELISVLLSDIDFKNTKLTDDEIHTLKLSVEYIKELHEFGKNQVKQSYDKDDFIGTLSREKFKQLNMSELADCNDENSSDGHDQK